MFRSITLFCLLLPAIHTRAQHAMIGHRIIDSLTRVLQTATADSVRAKACYLLSYNWVFSDPVKAKGYLEEGRRYAANPFQKAVGNFYEGILHYVSGDISSSEMAFMRADSLLQPIHTRVALKFRAESWHNFGVLQQAKGDEKAFADILLHHAIPLAQQSGDSAVLGKNYHDLALTFKNTSQYEKAHTYILKAIGVFRAIQGRDELAVAFVTGAENYVLWEKFAEAKPMFDSANAILQAHPESPLYVDYYTAESTYLNGTKQFDKALQSAARGIALAKQLKRGYEEQRLQLQRFYAWFDQKNYRQAKPVLLYLLRQPEMMAQITNRLQVYKGLAETHAGLGEMQEAYQWSKAYSLLSDSVHESQMKQISRRLNSSSTMRRTKKRSLP